MFSFSLNLFITIDPMAPAIIRYIGLILTTIIRIATIMDTVVLFHPNFELFIRVYTALNIKATIAGRMPRKTFSTIWLFLN